jgi:hypothetical protein
MIFGEMLLATNLLAASLSSLSDTLATDLDLDQLIGSDRKIIVIQFNFMFNLF